MDFEFILAKSHLCLQMPAVLSTHTGTLTHLSKQTHLLARRKSGSDLVLSIH